MSIIDLRDSDLPGQSRRALPVPFMMRSTEYRERPVDSKARDQLVTSAQFQATGTCKYFIFSFTSLRVSPLKPPRTEGYDFEIDGVIGRHPLMIHFGV